MLLDMPLFFPPARATSAVKYFFTFTVYLLGGGDGLA
jgi:hypothetical protein